MSEVNKNTVDDADDREGSSLRAPWRLEEDLQEIHQWMSGDALYNNVLLPRFGLLSLLLRTTPCFVYGLDSFKKKFGTTAFTDGVHIYICDDFYDKLLKDTKDSKFKDYGIELLLLHELMHVAFNHTTRLKQFPHAIRNHATDLSINTRLQVGFPDMPWVKTLKECGLGFKAGDIERYSKLAEETIAQELANEKHRQKMEEQKKQQQQQKQQQQNGGGQQQGNQNGNSQQQGNQNGGQQQGNQNGNGQQQGNQNGSGQQQQQPGGGGQQQGNQNGGGQQSGDQSGGQDPNQPNQNGEFGAENDRHFHDMKDVIQALEEEGLQNVIDALNLPSSQDEAGIKQIEEQATLRQHEAVQRAAAQMHENGGKYPGAHIAEAAADYVSKLTKGKLAWKLALREAIFGDGMRFKYNSEEFGDPFFVEEIEELVGVALPVGQDLPFKPDETVMVLIDTSGSVADEDLRAFLSEVMELKMASNGFGDSATEVIVLSADTVLRGEPVEITDQNAEEYMSKGIKIYGRGGTDLAEPIRQAAKLDMFKDKKIKSLVYFSDLFASIPTFNELGLPEGTSVTYVSAPSTTAGAATQEEAFRRGVADYAEVVPIREGIEINLDQEARDAGNGVEDYGSKPKRKMG